MLENLQASLEAHGPTILAAIAILVIGYIIALIARAVLAGAFDRLPFIADANAKSPGKATIGNSLGSAGYWIVILGTLVLFLEKIGMTSVSTSIRGTLDQIFAYLPQIIGAAITFFVFMIVARVARQATSAVLEAAQADDFPKRAGFAEGPVGITSPLSAIVFALVIIPGGIAALQVLNIEAITGPAVNMLDKVMAAIPNIAVAAIVIGIFAVIGRFVQDLAGRVLPNTGIDGAVAKMGLLKGADAGVTPSRIIAQISGFVILLLGLIQGTRTLGFEPLTNALDVVLSMGSQILFGSVIIFAGVLISGVVTRAMAATGDGATDFAAKLVRYVIIILASILGISRMGLDPSGTFITNAASIILIGAALAGGIAFGIGGKGWAAKQLEKLG